MYLSGQFRGSKGQLHIALTEALESSSLASRDVPTVGTSRLVSERAYVGRHRNMMVVMAELTSSMWWNAVDVGAVLDNVNSAGAPSMARTLRGGVRLFCLFVLSITCGCHT